jgi:SAM-dependent methyltransferase
MVERKRSNSTDAAWERIARTNPYWAVLSQDQFNGLERSCPALDDFWATGHAHVRHVMSVLERRLDSRLRPKIVVDFGCGVGRLLVPLAARTDYAYGVDVSPTMVSLSRTNLRERNIANAAVVTCLEELSALKAGVDLVHSTLVFQHIRPKRGLQLFAQLVGLLRPGGCGAVQFFLARRAPTWRVAVGTTRMRYRAVNIAVNLTRGHLTAERLPYEMNPYEVKELLVVLSEAGICDAWFETVVSADSVDAMVYFKRVA